MTQLFDLQSLNYYEHNSELFVDNTLEVDMSSIYSKFLESLPHGGRLLDLGCGSGRDAKNFKKLGYDVTAIDASKSMVSHTKMYFDGDVRLMRFDQIDFHEEFDGIWACASLIHVPRAGLSKIFDLCISALKPGGKFYLSFKYGTKERFSNGRHFTDMDIEQLGTLFHAFEHTFWITEDLRATRQNESWLNALVNKPQNTQCR